MRSRISALERALSRVHDLVASIRNEPRQHSASSIELARKCRHAWGLCYLDGLRPAEIPWSDIVKAEARGETITEYGGQRGAALGKEVHARAEAYEVKGADAVEEWDDEPGVVLRELIELLPPPGTIPPELVEREFAFEVDGVHYKGLMDLDGVPPHGEPEGALFGVWDHKTTKNILEYALLPHGVALELGVPKRSLLDNLQACLYVLERSIRTLRDRIPARWNYTETGRSRRSLAVVQTIHATHALQVVRQANEVARECETYKTSADAPCNTLACGDYGGCWYRGRHCWALRDYGAIMRQMENTGAIKHGSTEVVQGSQEQGRGRKRQGHRQG